MGCERSVETNGCGATCFATSRCSRLENILNMLRSRTGAYASSTAPSSAHIRHHPPVTASRRGSCATQLRQLARIRVSSHVPSGPSTESQEDDEGDYDPDGPSSSSNGDGSQREPRKSRQNELNYGDERVSDAVAPRAMRSGSISSEDTPESITDVEASSFGPILDWVTNQRDLVTLSYAVLIGAACGHVAMQARPM